MRSSRSSSSASTRSNSSLHDTEPTIPIFVKLLSGETIPLNLPSSTPIATLLQLLSLRTSIPPTSLRLHLAGKHLIPTPTTSTSGLSSADPASTLESLSIPASSTLTLSLPLLGGMASTTTTSFTTTSSDAAPASATSSTTSTPTPPPSRKPRIQRCTHKSCNAPAQRIVGDCGFCAGHFCGRHRMLEDHKCAGLEDCKKESHERNADKLNSERTMVVRGI